MNIPCVAQRNTLLRIGSTILVILLLPAIAVAQQPMAPAPPPGSNANNPPRADAGPNQKIGVHPNVLAVPTLDGTKSFDPDFDVITYKWKDSSGMVIGTGPTVQVVLAFPGTYTYALTVCDTNNACASASTTVEVVIDVRAPVVDAPDLTVNVTDPGGATVSKSTALSNYVLSGATTSAVDDVDPNPRFLRVVTNNLQVSGSTFFPEGDTPVSVFYTDQAGNVGMSPATIHVVDRQDDDIFILTGEGNCFFTPCNDVIQRVRGGVVEDFCQLAGGSSPGRGIIFDSSGRVVAIREAVNIAGSSGLEMVRCSVKGAPPEKFAFFQGHGGVPAGYPEPFPGLLTVDGGGLALARLREVVIDDHQNNGNPFIINEDAYLLNLVVPAGSQNTNRPVIYHVKQDFWENAPDLGPTLSGVSIGSPGASLYFHSGATYAIPGGGGCLDRIKIPLSIHATGTLGGVSFDLMLGLFGSSGEICGSILNDETVPDVNYSPTCPGFGPGFSFAVMDGFTQVFFDDSHGHGLTLISNSGAAGNGVLTNFSEVPFDDPGNPSNFFFNPNIGCLVFNQVRYTPLYNGAYFGGPIAIAPRGLIAMFGGVGFSNSSLDEVTSSGQLTPIVSGGLGPVGFVTAWPPNVSAGAAISVLIRIDSPVDVLVTDPNGKKLGVQNGAPVNDFGNDGSDTGASSHPRFYAINNPVPGDFKVESVGTGSGPYTVHVYSVDTSKPFGQHIFSSGNAAPGALSNQNFTFGAGASIAFTNHSPTANAGPDQTVNAAANGTATVNLDGSASSDPDGDSLTFTWAGPFGLVNGAQPQVTLPAGAHVLMLTVDDGKGGTASSTVTITVIAPIVVNQDPIAVAGTDQLVEATSAAGASVTLNASGSTDPDGNPLTFTWTGPFGTLMGVTINPTLALGMHTITLTVDDGRGGTASDTVLVTVQDTTPPAVTPPASISVLATEAGGTRGNATPALAAFLSGGLAVDLVDASLTRLAPQVAGADADNTTLLPLGASTVTFRFRDASGNLGTATANVTVNPAANLALSLSVSPASPVVGVDLTYTLVVANNGPQPATAVTLSDPLPAGATFVSASASAGTCSGTTTVSCSLGTVVGGTSVTVRIVVRPAAGGTLNNTASVAAAESDPDLANNAAAAATNVLAPDFVLSASPARINISGGAAANTLIVITPSPGPYPSRMDLACGSLPPRAACRFEPASLTPGASTIGSVLTITTDGTMASLPNFRPAPLDLRGFVWVTLALLGILAWGFLARAGAGRLPLRLGIGLLVLVLLWQAACAGGLEPTPRGTYTITVTATSGSTQHSTTVTLEVR